MQHRMLNRIKTRNFGIILTTSLMLAACGGAATEATEVISARLIFSNVDRSKSHVLFELGYTPITQPDGGLTMVCERGCTVEDLFDLDPDEAGIRETSIVFEGRDEVLLIVQERLDELGVEYSCGLVYEGTDQLYECDLGPLNQR